jgi:DNA polymerase-3 subunit gamma/tau
LFKATGERWIADQVAGESAPSLREVQDAVRAAEQQALRKSPLVEAAFAAFPGAEIIEDESAGSDHGNRNWRNRA